MSTLKIKISMSQSSGMGGAHISPKRTSRRVALPPGRSQLDWMRLCQAGKNLSGRPINERNRKITIEDVVKHHTQDDCWTVLDGKVYNITPYLQYHPGGVSDLMLAAGGDCTALFYETHAWVNGHSMLEKCYIGELMSSVSVTKASSRNTNEVLSPSEWTELKLISKTQNALNTWKFTLEIPKGKVLGLQMPGQHVKFRATINGKVIERAYTPSSKFSQLNIVEFLIKIYPDGLMTSYLSTLEIGKSIEVLGPQGSIGYGAPGKLSSNLGTPQDIDHMLLVAAGSGITPMLQLIRAVFEPPLGITNDKTKITLVYCSHSLAHIIAKDLLEPLGNMFPDQITIHHILTESSTADSEELKSFEIGRFNPETLKPFIEPMIGNPRTALLHSGPFDFDMAVDRIARAWGYSDDQVYEF